MSRKVTELTSEEIAKMFPVELQPYDEKWPALFDREKELIVDTIGEKIILRIEHFGSTSIPGMLSKDTIDILIEIPEGADFHESMIQKMNSIEYDFMWQEDDTAAYMIFVKGYDTAGQKKQAYHVHAAPKEHDLWNRIYFRDYLEEHKEIASAYAELKRKLAVKFKYDRVGYRIAKTEFISNITNLAKQHYSDRK